MMIKRPFIYALLSLLIILCIFFAGTMLMNNQQQSFSIGQKIGVIDIKGTITDSRKIIKQLQEFSDNNSVKAIVLRIDSPGGGVGPSQEIHDEVFKIAQHKPVVSSMGSVAASGGYYVAAPTQVIFANPGTITGSIGVIMEFTNVLQLMDRVGLKSNVIKSGVNKDIGSPLREMTASEKVLLQGLIDDVYDQFVEAVSTGRNLPVAKVRALADGRIFTGRQALKAGLVDKLGGLQPAIAEAARLGGISGKPDVIYPAEPTVNFLDYFVGKTVTHINKYLAQSNSAGLQLLWLPAN
jgi:protease-4